jgi:hypothetical protein
MGEMLPEYEKSENPKTPNYDVLPVWDLEKEAWRSFRVENVISFRVA